MKELMENKLFCKGVAAGLKIYQDAVIAAHKEKKPLVIGKELYYVQDGRERLQEMIEKVCR